MSRTLTVPAPMPDAAEQHISSMRFEIPAVRDLDSMKISKDHVKLWYEVITYDVDGSILQRNQKVVPFIDWPPSFIADVKAVYQKVYADAENSGLILGPGTDEPLE